MKIYSIFSSYEMSYKIINENHPFTLIFKSLEF